MTIIRVGATQKYAVGWETAFGGKGKKKSGGAAVMAGKKKARRKTRK